MGDRRRQMVSSSHPGSPTPPRVRRLTRGSIEIALRAQGAASATVIKPRVSLRTRGGDRRRQMVWRVVSPRPAPPGRIRFMPEHAFQLIALLQVLENDVHLGEALFYPEVSCLDDNPADLVEALLHNA